MNCQTYKQTKANISIQTTSNSSNLNGKVNSLLMTLLSPLEKLVERSMEASLCQLKGAITVLAELDQDLQCSLHSVGALEGVQHTLEEPPGSELQPAMWREGKRDQLLPVVHPRFLLLPLMFFSVFFHQHFSSCHQRFNKDPGDVSFCQL